MQTGGRVAFPEDQCSGETLSILVFLKKKQLLAMQGEIASYCREVRRAAHATFAPVCCNL